MYCTSRLSAASVELVILSMANHVLKVWWIRVASPKTWTKTIRCLTKESRRRDYDFSGVIDPEGGRCGEADDGNERRNPARDVGSVQKGHQEGKGPHARPCRGSYRLQQGLCLPPAVSVREKASCLTCDRTAIMSPPWVRTKDMKKNPGDLECRSSKREIISASPDFR